MWRMARMQKMKTLFEVIYVTLELTKNTPTRYYDFGLSFMER